MKKKQIKNNILFNLDIFGSFLNGNKKSKRPRLFRPLHPPNPHPSKLARSSRKNYNYNYNYSNPKSYEKSNMNKYSFKRRYKKSIFTNKSTRRKRKYSRKNKNIYYKEKGGKVCRKMNGLNGGGMSQHQPFVFQDNQKQQLFSKISGGNGKGGYTYNAPYIPYNDDEATSKSGAELQELMLQVNANSRYDKVSVI